MEAVDGAPFWPAPFLSHAKKNNNGKSCVPPQCNWWRCFKYFQVELNSYTLPDIQLYRLVCMCLMTCIFWDSLSSLFVGTSEKGNFSYQGFQHLPLRTQPPFFRSQLIINPFNKTYFISSWPVEGSISSNCLVVSSKLLGCCWWDPPRKNLSHLDLFFAEDFFVANLGQYICQQHWIFSTCKNTPACSL